MPDRSRRTFLAGVAGVAIVGAATAGGIVFNRTDGTASAQTPVAATTTPAVSSSTSSSTASTSTATTAPSTTAPSTAASFTTAAASTYQNGSYTQTGDYDNPEGGASLTVTVTLADDVVTATSATGTADGGPSSQYQAQFISGYAGEVVGKDVDSISLSRVSGSSLTSNGFNAALAKIKSEAKA